LRDGSGGDLGAFGELAGGELIGRAAAAQDAEQVEGGRGGSSVGQHPAAILAE